MWIATLHAEDEYPYVIARSKFRGAAEMAANMFVARIPHPEVTQHWVTIEEEHESTDDL